MDAVDRVERQRALMERESGLTDDEALERRVSETYRRMGLPVPEESIREVVRTTREGRLAHRPMPPGPARAVALAYVRRGAAAAVLLSALAAWGGVEAGRHVLVTRPALQEAAAGAARDLADARRKEDLAQAASKSLAGIVATGADGDEVASATRMAEGARLALSQGREGDALGILAGMDAARALLAEDYAVTVVSRTGEPSGVARARDGTGDVAYYAIVEAVGPDGRPVPREVVDAETGARATVAKWGQRVDAARYGALRDDKARDGRVDEAVIGNKRRGVRGTSWSGGVMQGTITSWR